MTRLSDGKGWTEVHDLLETRAKELGYKNYYDFYMNADKTVIYEETQKAKEKLRNK